MITLIQNDRLLVDMWPDGYHPFGPTPCPICGKPFTIIDGFKTREPAIRVCFSEHGNGYPYLCKIVCSEGCAGMLIEQQGNAGEALS